MNGILNVYKEKGFTSHDVVAKLRGICHQKKIGHTGTLDPDAEGVLPVCLGSATKICGLITDKDKEYETVLLLGKETDTQDITGNTRSEFEVTCTQEELTQIIHSFVRAYDQIPPMYSALKVNGQKLYELARNGIEVERKPRNVQIYEIQIEWIRLPRVKLRVHCSKGTYIRTLCHDIGQAAGCGGCMETLLRTRVSSFSLENAVTLAQIEQKVQENRISDLLLPPDCLFLEYPKTNVHADFKKMLVNGNRLPRCAFTISENSRDDKEYETVRVYLDDTFYAIYAWDTGLHKYKPLKIFGQGN